MGNEEHSTTHIVDIDGTQTIWVAAGNLVFPDS